MKRGSSLSAHQRTIYLWSSHITAAASCSPLTNTQRDVKNLTRSKNPNCYRIPQRTLWGSSLDSERAGFEVRSSKVTKSTTAKQQKWTQNKHGWHLQVLHQTRLNDHKLWWLCWSLLVAAALVSHYRATLTEELSHLIDYWGRTDSWRQTFPLLLWFLQHCSNKNWTRVHLNTVGIFETVPS